MASSAPEAFSSSAPQPPELMKAAGVRGYGDIDEMVFVSNDFAKPKLEAGSGKLLVKVQAVSLAPGDWRVMSGYTSLMQYPDAWPYIPCGDFAGVVEEVSGQEQKFKVGDSIVGTFQEPRPFNCLAEYTLVPETHAALLPSNITPKEASGLPSSALASMVAVDKYLKEGDKVLVLGASGGVGTHLIQMLKPKASYVAATSTQKDLVLSLGADKVLDYRTEKWWETEEPFDLIFDVFGGHEPWERACAGGCKGKEFEPLTPLNQ